MFYLDEGAADFSDTKSEYKYVSAAAGAIYHITSSELTQTTKMSISSNTYEYIDSYEGGTGYIMNYVDLDSEKNKFLDHSCTNTGCVFLISATQTLSKAVYFNFLSDDFKRNIASKLSEDDLAKGSCFFISSTKSFVNFRYLQVAGNKAEEGGFLHVASMAQLDISFSEFEENPADLGTIVIQSPGIFNFEENAFYGNSTTNKASRQEYLEGVGKDYTYGGLVLLDSGLVVNSKANTYGRFSYIERGAAVFVNEAQFNDDSSTFENN